MKSQSRTESEQAKRMRKTDLLWGIERDRDSDACEELVVPVIWLWSKPMILGGQVVAVAEHGESVEILEGLLLHARRYYRVRPARAVYVGKLRQIRGWLQRRPPDGWITDTLLKNYGILT